jgi:hypothetical protein
MPHPRRRAGFAQKTKSRRFITEISLADDFYCHRASQVDIERLVSDAHCAPTQLDRFSVLARHQFIILKALPRLFECGLDGILGSRRLSGLNPASKSLAKHADRTEFHRSGKLVTATRALRRGSVFMGLTALQPQYEPKSRKQHHAPPSGAKAAGTAPGKLLSRCTINWVFIYSSASNHVSEQNS